MGHIRLPHLPRTKRWQEVVDLVGDGAGSAAAVASATLDAIDDSFASGGDDAGLVRAVWLLANLPDAAKSGDFANALGSLGVWVSANPSVAEVTAAISDPVDNHGNVEALVKEGVTDENRSKVVAAIRKHVTRPASSG